ncbi:hypothetical protein BGX30_014303 [Mortierella sp. GBA39]|nr:hypothetical protein BGX30_014303 [Mortierella sp. GBA39]
MGLTKTYKDGSTPVVAIIGSGFSGICAAIRIQTQLNISTFTIFELEPDIGGTWWSNTYPGCACDVKAHNYAFSFEPNYNWSCNYAPQPEIWDYLRNTARKYKLYEKTRFRTEITHVAWNEGRQKWVLDHVNLNNGEREQTEADIVFSGMGPLRVPQIPKEFENFEGPKWHTAQWNHAYDLTNKRVAVVGSGASAIQVVPSIVKKVNILEYYQRTASYIVPRRNATYSSLWKWIFRTIPFVHFIYYKLLYWSSEFTVAAFSSKLKDLIPRKFMTLMAWFFRYVQVRDKVLRKKLTPTYDMGCRRIVVSSNYYPALTRKNVSVHTEPIVGVKGQTLKLMDGSEQEVDALILATGFHVQEIFPKGFMIGKEGQCINTVFGKNPHTYYGLTAPETPNMFFLLGPNTGLGHNSILFMVEAQVEYVIKTISYMMEKNLSSIQVTKEACKEFIDELDEKMKGMVWSSTCKSWYQNDEGRVTALWWSSCTHYWWRLRSFHPKRFVGVKRI